MLLPWLSSSLVARHITPDLVMLSSLPGLPEETHLQQRTGGTDNPPEPRSNVFQDGRMRPQRSRIRFLQESLSRTLIPTLVPPLDLRFPRKFPEKTRFWVGHGSQQSPCPNPGAGSLGRKEAESMLCRRGKMRCGGGHGYRAGTVRYTSRRPCSGMFLFAGNSSSCDEAVKRVAAPLEGRALTMRDCGFQPIPDLAHGLCPPRYSLAKRVVC